MQKGRCNSKAPTFMSVCAADWAGRQAVPRVDKYDIKPYEPEDDDEYRTDAEKAKLQSQLPSGGGVSGGVRPSHAQAQSPYTTVI